MSHMPNTPEEEGARELLTIAEIVERFGVSRTTLHAARRRGAFPSPTQPPESTRNLYDADEVAAYFAANPKRPGRRTDLEGPESPASG